MPEPKFIAQAANWKRTRGLKVGTSDDNTVDFAEVDFEGPMRDAEAFRNQWEPGASCPVAGFAHLLLRARPTCKARGPLGYSTLRFEAPSTDGQNGDSDVEVQETMMRLSVELGSEGNAADRAIYSYNSPTAIVSYTADSRRGSHRYSVLLNRFSDLEDPKPLKKESGLGSVKASELAEGVDYEVVEISEITSQTNRGNVWEVVETHSVHIQQYVGGD